MQLDGPQQKQLQVALISAFPTRLSLEQMVFHGLSVHLSAITAEGSLEQVVFELLRWAQARGRLEELITAALAHNSGNQGLQRVAVQLGVSSGQSSSDVPPTATLPCIWNVPYPRNPFFTGQENVLAELANALKAGQATALSQPQAVTGLGGIGKTQIAVEFAYRHREDYRAVFWVFADTRESLVSGYLAVAQLLNLPQKDEQGQEIIVQAVSSWLSTHGSWLLILDNADELAMVRKFVPPLFGGHILLTTRARSAGPLARCIEVEVMPEDIGALFLLRRASLVAPDAKLVDAAASDLATAKAITSALGGLPLALDQAGAYIEEIPCRLQDYLDLYRTRGTELLEDRGHLVVDHPEPVVKTWLLSFEKVEQKNPAAAELLRLCAFLAPDAIPEEIVTKGAEYLGSVLGPVASDPLLLNAAIAVLGAYSLIRRDRSEKTLSVHRLVQAVLKEMMPANMKHQWAKQMILAVSAVFPQEEDFTTWPQRERCLPHALVCVDLIEQEQICIPEAASVLHKAGVYLIERLRYPEAEPLLRQAWQMRSQYFGEAHVETANTLNRLGRLFRVQGRYDEAERVYQQALSIRQEQLGEAHPDTASSLNNVALLYENQGRYEAAEPLYLRALAIQEEQLGPKHLETANSLNNLAQLYRAQGRCAEAEALWRRALRIREEQLGESHPKTATSLNNLGGLYKDQGRYIQAEALLQRALSIREEVLGETHPDTALSLWWLAVVSERQQQYEKAMPWYKRALSVFVQVLGERHPDTQAVQQQYATLLKKMGCAEPETDRLWNVASNQGGTEA